MANYSKSHQDRQRKFDLAQGSGRTPPFVGPYRIEDPTQYQAQHWRCLYCDFKMRAVERVSHLPHKGFWVPGLSQEGWETGQHYLALQFGFECELRPDCSKAVPVEKLCFWPELALLRNDKN